MLAHPTKQILALSLILGACAPGESRKGQGVAPGTTKAWTMAIGGKGGDSVSALAVDPSGDVVTAGGFGDDVTFGETTHVTLGGKDIYLAKFTSSGSVRWSKAFGSVRVDEVTSMLVDQAGNIFLAGTFLESIDFGGGSLAGVGGSDIFVTKLGPDGSHVWSKVFGGDGLDGDAKLTFTNDGGLMLAAVFSEAVTIGEKALTSQGSTDVFLARLTSEGAVVQASSFGGEETESVTGAVSTPAGAIVSGGYSGSFKLGTASLTSQGEDDAFILKFTPPGS